MSDPIRESFSPGARPIGTLPKTGLLLRRTADPIAEVETQRPCISLRSGFRLHGRNLRRVVPSCIKLLAIHANTRLPKKFRIYDSRDRLLPSKRGKQRNAEAKAAKHLWNRSGGLHRCLTACCSGCDPPNCWLRGDPYFKRATSDRLPDGWRSWPEFHIRQIATIRLGMRFSPNFRSEAARRAAAWCGRGELNPHCLAANGFSYQLRLSPPRTMPGLWSGLSLHLGRTL